MRKKSKSSKEGQFRDEPAQPPSGEGRNRQARTPTLISPNNATSFNFWPHTFEDADIQLIHERHTTNQFGKTISFETVIDTRRDGSDNGTTEKKTLLH